MADQQQPPILTLPQELLDRIAKKLVVCVRPGGEMVEVTPEKLALFLKTILRPAHVNKSFSYTFRKAFFENHIFLFEQKVEYPNKKGQTMQERIAELGKLSVVPLAWRLPYLRRLKTIVLSSPLRDDRWQRSVHFVEAFPAEIMKLVKHVKVSVNLEFGRADTPKGDCWFFLRGLKGYGLSSLRSLEVKVGGMAYSVGGELRVWEALDNMRLEKKAQKVHVQLQDE